MLTQTLMSQTVLPARSTAVFGTPLKAAAPLRTQVRRDSQQMLHLNGLSEIPSSIDNLDHIYDCRLAGV